MTIIMKSPLDEVGHTAVIPNDLYAMQAIVGGHIEVALRMGDALVIANEEGLLLDLPYNCCIGGINLYGTIFVVGVDGEEFTSCPLSFKEWEKIVKEWNK